MCSTLFNNMLVALVTLLGNATFRPIGLHWVWFNTVERPHATKNNRVTFNYEMISHTNPNTLLNSLLVDGICINIHVYLQILQTVHKIYNWQMYSGNHQSTSGETWGDICCHFILRSWMVFSKLLCLENSSLKSDNTERWQWPYVSNKMWSSHCFCYKS